MDPLDSEAQRQIGGGSSEAASQGSAKNAQTEKRAPKSQSAGQPSELGGSGDISLEAASKGSPGKAQKKKPEPKSQNTVQPSEVGGSVDEPERLESRSVVEEGRTKPTSSKDLVKGSKTCCGCCRKSTSESVCNRFLSFFGLGKKKKIDDLVVFDENASLDQSLLWSKNGPGPTSNDYLEFVPEHERALTEYTSSLDLPTPPADRVDY